MSNSSSLAAALERVRTIADKNNAEIVQSKDLQRSDRELLIKTGWLQEIMRGWYMLVRPDLVPGDSAAWYANIWDFLRIYLNDRYDSNYCLSAENSLELHVKTPLTPKQIIVIAPSGGGKIQALPYETSLVLYVDPKNIPKERQVINGLQVMTLPFALCKVSPTFFRNNQKDSEIALSLIRSSSELLQVILEHGFKRAADRMVGAYEYLGRHDISKHIVDDLTAAGTQVTSENPFSRKSPILMSTTVRSPYASRIKAIWHEARDIVLQHFPKEPDFQETPAEYLQHIDDIYKYDAYHSLSIEGYSVSSELIDRVKSNEWKPEIHTGDANERNALAARGYYEAFNKVKTSVEKVLNGASPAEVLENDFRDWYRSLFGPSVQAKIIPATALAGYRNDRVHIRNSRHSPPPKEAVLDAMDSFFSCMTEEKSAAVRAVLGHYIFVFIHPYMDGNGRMARFIMNLMLASGGYPWTIVRVEKRRQYIEALEHTHVGGDIGPLAKFIAHEMEKKW